jgi:hypothetical protein
MGYVRREILDLPVNERNFFPGQFDVARACVLAGLLRVTSVVPKLFPRLTKLIENLTFAALKGKNSTQGNLRQSR